MESMKQKMQLKQTDSEIEQFCQQEKQSFLGTQERIQKDSKIQDGQQSERERRDSKWIKSQTKIQEQTEEMLRHCRMEKQICKEEKDLCSRNNQERGQSQTYCHRREEQCEQRRMVREVNRENLQLLQKGSSIVAFICTSLKKSGSSKRILSHSHISMAQRIEPTTEELVVSGNVIVESLKMNRPYKWSILSYVQNKLPKSIWSSSQLVEEDVSSSVHVHSEFGIQGREEVLFSGNLKAFKSQEQKDFARTSEWSRKCEEDKSEGRKLTKNCKEARHQSVTLDELIGTVSVSSNIVKSPLGNTALALVKGYLIPYLSVRSTGQEKDHGQIEYCMKGKLSREGERASLIISGNGQETHLKDVRMGSYTKDLVSMCKRECAFNHFVQRITNFKTPASCVLEAGNVKTFDRVNYDYELNNCEHVVFQDCSEERRVSVSTKKTSAKQYVTMVVDGHKYQVEINTPGKYTRSGKATIKVNGQEKKWVSFEDAQEEERQLEHQSKEIQRQNYQREKLEFREGKNNYYNDKLTYITESKDGVMMIVSQKYGVTVLCDGKRMEINSSEDLFRNKACGLCGDLNDEKSADLDSSKKCTMSKPRLAALSYMVEDGKCQGISREEKSELEREQQTCVKRVEMPSKVMEIFNREQQSRPALQMRHIIQEAGAKICFSRNQLRSCSKEFPKEVRAQQIGFSCLARSKAQEVLERVKAGELIEELRNLPTNFSETVYEPTRC